MCTSSLDSPIQKCEFGMLFTLGTNSVCVCVCVCVLCVCVVCACVSACVCVCDPYFKMDLLLIYLCFLFACPMECYCQFSFGIVL